MKLNMSFKERAQIALANLANQPSVTLEAALKQVKWLKEKSKVKLKKLK